MGDQARRAIRVGVAFAQAIEAAQHGHGVAVVEAVTLRNDLAVAHDQLDAAVKRARHRLVGDARARQMAGAVPGDPERGAGGAVAQLVGAHLAHAGGARGVGDDAAFGQRLEKDADALGRPAVFARRTSFAPVATGGERRIDQTLIQSVGDLGERLSGGLDGRRSIGRSGRFA